MSPTSGIGRAVGLLSISLMVLTIFTSVPVASVAEEASFQFDSGYHTYAEMKTLFEKWETDYPGMVMTEVIGTTTEGRNIYAVKISDDVTYDDPDEPETLIIGCHHAREIITVEIPLLAMQDLLTMYGKNATVTRMVNTMQMWFIPMLNVDGHVVVEGDNDWRKNKRDNNGNGQFDAGDGVDLNRNYDDGHWGLPGGASTNPTSEIYKGPYGFSENETRAVRDFAGEHDFITSLSYHSYSELVLYPWGYTDTHVSDPDYGIFVELADAYADLSGYTAAQGYDLYMVTGEIDDYLYNNQSVYSMTVEVGTSFYPPDDQIDDLYDENDDGLFDNIIRGRDLAGDPQITDGGIFEIDVLPQDDIGIVPANETVDIIVSTMNYGTGAADIPVDILVTCANDTGYQFTADTLVTADAGEVFDAHFSWDVPYDGNFDYCITASSSLTGDSHAWNDVNHLTVRSGAFYGLELFMQNASVDPIIVYPDSSADVNLTLRNIGNSKDSYLFALKGDKPHWSTVPGPMEVEALETGDLGLTITVPRSATKDVGKVFGITVTARSVNDTMRSAELAFEIKVGDPLPVAYAGPDTEAQIFVPVEFDGTGSTVPSGEIVNYTWRSSDGWIGYGPAASHAFGLAGAYEVKLEVLSDLDFGDDDKMTVTVPVVNDIMLDLAPIEDLYMPGDEIVFSLEVLNNGSDYDDVDLELVIEGLGVTETHSLFSLKPLENRTHEFLVPVPAVTPGGEEYLYSLEAASRTDAEAKAVASGTFLIGTVHGMTHLFSKKATTVDNGGTAVFDLQFNNAGNVEEAATVSYGSVDANLTMPAGVDVTVDAFGSEIVTVKVGIGGFAPAGNHKVPVLLRYIDPVTGLEDEFIEELTVTVSEFHRTDAVLLGDTRMDVAFKETGTINVVLVNDGNVDEVFHIDVVTVLDGNVDTEFTGDTDTGFNGTGTVPPFSNVTIVIEVQAYTTELEEEGGTIEYPVQIGTAGKTFKVTIAVSNQKTGPTDTASTSDIPMALILIIIIIVVAVTGVVMFMLIRRRPPAPAGQEPPPGGSPPRPPDDTPPPDARPPGDQNA